MQESCISAARAAEDEEEERARHAAVKVSGQRGKRLTEAGPKVDACLAALRWRRVPTARRGWVLAPVGSTGVVHWALLELPGTAVRWADSVLRDHRGRGWETPRPLRPGRRASSRLVLAYQITYIADNERSRYVPARAHRQAPGFAECCFCSLSISGRGETDNRPRSAGG